MLKWLASRQRRSEDDLIVFYFGEATFRLIEARLHEHGIENSLAQPELGLARITVADPDGRRIMLHHGQWIARLSEYGVT